MCWLQTSTFHIFHYANAYFQLFYNDFVFPGNKFLVLALAISDLCLSAGISQSVEYFV